MTTPKPSSSTTLKSPKSNKTPEQNKKLRERRINTASAFHCQTKKEECALITPLFIKEAQKTGIIKLTAKGLQAVPDKLWKIQELQVSNLEDQYCFNHKPDVCWWNRKSIEHLDLSSNVIAEISKDIQEFQDLKTLNLHDNNITTLPDEIGKLTNLVKLDLSRNKLTVLPKNFWKLTELTNLNLSRNKLSKIPKETTDLIMLEKLDLSENELTSLPRGLGFLIRLVELNLSHNKLTVLPPDIANLRDLKKLDVSHNKLKCLPDLGELRKIEFLYAFNNKITEIPNMHGCVSLKECYLGFNEITEITKEFCEDMVNLRVLELPNNKIHAIPDEIGKMQQLVRFNVQNNSIVLLPNTLCLLPHLQNVNLEGNVFRNIRRDLILCGTTRILKFLRENYESELAEKKEDLVSPNQSISQSSVNFPDRFSLRATKTLSLGNQKLSEIPDSVFEDFKNVEGRVIDICKNYFTEVPPNIIIVAKCLTELNMSNNKLKTLPEFLSEFSSLKYLNVNSNLITDIPKSLGQMKKLQELDISHNRLTKVPECIYEMIGLEILVLRDNKIAELNGEAFLQLTRLAVLDLTNNNISHIPPILGRMKQLRSLELYGNCFRLPTYNVLEKGTESVLSYLRDKIPA